MKSFRNVSLALLCLLPFTACSTFNHVRWAMDDTSVYNEPEGGFSRGVVKPLWTIVGFPVAVAWDVVTFPFQIISGVYPYSDSVMAPDEDIDI